MTAAQFWEERYGDRPVWSGKVNVSMAGLVAGLPTGRALELGCGEGGDALWLAEQGWQVTAVDISPTAITRGRAMAVERGLADRVEWIAADLTNWVPEGAFDLVTASFLQSPIELERAAILRRAAQALAPGGHLLLVSHAAAPPWASGLHHGHAEFPQPATELALLGLPAIGWQIVVAEVRRRPAVGPDGTAAELDDTVVLVRRD
ncbi:methyltransferase family protein [Propionicimonas paludicola]|uniref:Methyltransferase family protein n=1 Tax=Propionicimonas paludicola TaxID=185243 RepID=A0A2A9CSQ7_9ACTN|nr:class I SAM-dependent methyltransferase [Propionicimonas paludicola]PFG16660.1 methyltransferase family protein [Propionicimonas paludicola]